jgi:hypothetical protein
MLGKAEEGVKRFGQAADIPAVRLTKNLDSNRIKALSSVDDRLARRAQMSQL